VVAEPQAEDQWIIMDRPGVQCPTQAGRPATGSATGSSPSESAPSESLERTGASSSPLTIHVCANKNSKVAGHVAKHGQVTGTAGPAGCPGLLLQSAAH
jgi:hypothetical protein